MIKIYKELEQGSDEWKAARCGLITASQMNLVLTPTLKIANNDKTRSHVYELAAQRVNNYVEDSYISEDMIRGMIDEIDAKYIYAQANGDVDDVGFIVNSDHGFSIGYSPDGMCGDFGLIEIKSRRQKFQIETISKDEVPEEYILQIQTGLMVSNRKWCDFVSYCAGMPLYVKRVFPDAEIQQKIIGACTEFEAKIDAVVSKYRQNLELLKMMKTERKQRQEGEIQC